MTIPHLDLTSTVRKAEMPTLEPVSGNASRDEAEKIGELSRQFEALLLRQILKESRQSVIQSGLFEESTTADIYNDMINFHLAESISQSGSLGLAEALERELARQHNPARGNPPSTQDDAGEH